MSKRRSIFLSAISGNILEYYDFTVYATFATEIGRTFFSAEDEIIQTLSTLVVFAIGFITRPVGGIIFGSIGDRFGRRVALIISMLSMTLATFTIGFIPSYEVIGFYAPIILVIMRLIQGLCISGEGAGAAIFLLEHTQNFRPGFTAALVHSAGITGSLVASFIGIILYHFFPVLDFQWRFAFILGGIIGIIGFYFRLRVSETPIFKILAEKKKTLKAPFIHVVKTAWQSMLITAALGGAASSIVYLVKSYFKVYYCEVLHFSDTTALYLVSYSLVILIITMPISGYLADRIGRLKMITYASIAIILLSLPVLYLMDCTNMLQQILAVTILSMLAGFISGTAYVFIISLFTPEQRFSGVAFSYNFGIALFGGTSALISRWLVLKTNLYYSPAFYIIIVTSLFLLITYCKRSLIRELLEKNIKRKS
ncbi:MAG: MFS transporter [Rickettsiaceae bacterium]|nr:MFS transporter [Rickettsiaceae bacterium]